MTSELGRHVDCSTHLATVHLAGDETRDTPVHQHTLALLQKLSLGRAAQSELIDLGMVQWLVMFLERPDSLSELCLEYAMALLMNLCLRSAGRTVAETLPVLEVLDAFIQVSLTLIARLHARSTAICMRACDLACS